jgi:hypothetical protein
MQFGTRAADAPKLGNTPGEGDAGFMRTLKPGEYRMRFLQETDDWQQYWEHYNPTPGGFPFPCTGDRQTCPGCTSGIEKMEKASPKYAVNAKVGNYVNVYKFPVKFYNKMVIRSERNGGTVTDRDYLVTRIGNDTSTDYDIEMMMPAPLDKTYEINDIEKLLAKAFGEAWPEFDPSINQDQPAPSVDRREGLNEFAEPEAKQAPKEEKEVTEAELRAMSGDQLRALCDEEGIKYPEDLRYVEDSEKFVDWMLKNL